MRLVVILILLLAIGGCSTGSKSKSEVPARPVNREEAASLANTYIVLARGACGTGIRNIEDLGDAWRVETVFGLGERRGPDLMINKRSRKITEMNCAESSD